MNGAGGSFDEKKQLIDWQETRDFEWSVSSQLCLQTVIKREERERERVLSSEEHAMGMVNGGW